MPTLSSFHNSNDLDLTKRRTNRTRHVHSALLRAMRAAADTHSGFPPRCPPIAYPPIAWIFSIAASDHHWSTNTTESSLLSRDGLLCIQHPRQRPRPGAPPLLMQPPLTIYVCVLLCFIKPILWNRYGPMWPCVLLCLIKPMLGNRYVRSRGFIVSEPRETHPRSEIDDVPTSPCPPSDNLGWFWFWFWFVMPPHS